MVHKVNVCEHTGIYKHICYLSPVSPAFEASNGCVLAQHLAFFKQ